MKRILALMLAALLLAGLFSGCGMEEEGAYVPTGDALVMDDGPVVTQPREDEMDLDLTVKLTWYPDRSLNPLRCNDLTNRTLFSLIYQSLFTVDSDYNAEPMLCKRYSVSEDMRTYTIYLENATFSDGSLLTADDVSATLNAAKDSPYYGGRFYHVESITPVDGSTVSIRLRNPMENLPLLLDIPILKVSQLEEDRPLGTGPFFLEPSLGGMQLRRRKDWWCRADLPVDVESVSLMEAQSATQIRDTFEFEGLSLVCANPGSDSHADYRCDYELWECESGTFVYIGCNMNSGLFANDAVRKALTFAIDRDTLAEKYYRGFGRGAALPASPTSPFYDQALAGRYGYAPQRFTDALTTAGKQGATVQLLVNSDDSLRLRAARDIARMLTDCGLTVEMKELPTNAFKEALHYKTYDIYVGQTRLSANMDLTHFFYTWGELSYGNMEDGTLYALCQQALANSGNYYNLHQAVMEDGRLCPVLFYNYAVYVTRGVFGELEPARDNVFWYTLGKTMEDCRVDEEPVPETTEAET